MMFGGKLYPFESAILKGVGEELPKTLNAAFEVQINNINKVQRLLEWNEIEFYCMKLFKVQWPEESLFSDKKEFILGKGKITSRAHSAEVTVWAVNGHVFSIESKSALKPFRSMKEVSFYAS